MESMSKTIMVRGFRYHIPVKYILPELLTAMVPRAPEMDMDDGINLTIPLVDLGITPLPHQIPTGNADHVTVLLYGPAAFKPDNEYDLNPGAYNAWMGLGPYRHNRVIEKDETGLYRIYWRPGAKSWEYFEAPPSDKESISSPKWIAGCFFGPLEPEAEDMSNVICSTQVFTERGDIDISLTGRYISKIDKIIEGVRSKVFEWSKETK